MFVDDFNRASLGSNWATVLGATPWAIVSSLYLKPQTPFVRTIVRVVGTFPDNQWAEVLTEQPTGATSPPTVGPAVRINGTGDCYFVSMATTQLELYKIVAGTVTFLNSVAFTPTLGTFYKLKIIARTNKIDVYKDDVFLFTGTDTALTSGNPGCHAFTGEAATYPRFDSFRSVGIVGDDVKPAQSRVFFPRIPFRRGFSFRTGQTRFIPKLRPKPIIYVNRERPRGSYGRGRVYGSFTRYAIPPPPRIGNKLVVPFNTLETVADHFISRGWNKIQDQINAGYPYVGQPVPPTGQYVETIDYGVVYNSVIINLDWATSVIVGTVNVSATMETSLDRVTWSTPVVGSSMFVVSFRFLRITLNFTAVN